MGLQGDGERAMKVMNEGMGDYKKWWEGKILSCGTCRRVVLLERGDEDRAECSDGFPDEFRLRCAKCGSTLFLMKDRYGC